MNHLKKMFFALIIMTSFGATLLGQHLHNELAAIKNGDTRKLDRLLHERKFTQEEYGLLEDVAEKNVEDSKGWWIVSLLLILAGAILALRAGFGGIRLASHAAKLSRLRLLMTSGFLAVIGGIGLVVALKGYRDYTIYTKSPKILEHIRLAQKMGLYQMRATLHK